MCVNDGCSLSSGAMTALCYSVLSGELSQSMLSPAFDVFASLPGTYRLDAVFPVRYNKQICQQGSGDGVVCATDGTGNNTKDGLWIG